ncbi:MAG TPA: hypothetical protein VGI63_05975 [Verrucomicrobiae bacterium]
MANPANFISLAAVNYNPAIGSGIQSATRVTLASSDGVLASNVAAVKFNFTSPASENGYCGYAGITVFGMASLASAVPAASLERDVSDTKQFCHEHPQPDGRPEQYPSKHRQPGLGHLDQRDQFYGDTAGRRLHQFNLQLRGKILPRCGILEGHETSAKGVRSRRRLDILAPKPCVSGHRPDTTVLRDWFCRGLGHLKPEAHTPIFELIPGCFGDKISGQTAP